MTSRNVTGTATCRVGVTLLSHSSADGKLNSPAMLRWLRGKENTWQDGFSPCLHPHPSLVDEGLILSPFVSIQPSKDKPTFETSSLLPCWLRNYFSTSFVSLALIKMEIDALIVYFVPFMHLHLGLWFCCDGLQTVIYIMFFSSKGINYSINCKYKGRQYLRLQKNSSTWILVQLEVCSRSTSV